MLFHKDGGENIAVTNCMSHFSMFVPTKATVKLANGNTVHAQGIEIILYSFPNCLIIYPVGPVYYCPGHPSNTFSSCALKFYISFKRLRLKLLNIVTLLTPKVVLGDHSTRLSAILTIFTSKFPRSNLTEIRILLSQLSVYFQNKLSLNLYISVFGHVYITRLKRMSRKGLMEGLPENVPELKEP